MNDQPLESDFLTPAVMQGGDWKALELVVCRLLLHCGWRGLQYIGQAGDMGADVLAVRENHGNGIEESYLFQVKAVTGANYVGTKAIDEALKAQAFYKAKIAVVATNGDFRQSAIKKAKQLEARGYKIRLWNGTFLKLLLRQAPLYSSERKSPRQYQSKISEKVIQKYQHGGTKALFIVATGLGKTVIASTVADSLYKEGMRKILVLCHSNPLIFQLQKTFWTQISKNVPSRLVPSGEPPVPVDGINFGLYQTLFNNLGGVNPDAFDLIIVDEAHHAMASGFTTCLQHLTPKLTIGMTATPWRGDGLSIETLFGEPVETVSLVDGMKMGYLAKVDYRLMCDNIDWDEVPKISKSTLTIKDLNRRLFLPQRDDAVISELTRLSKTTGNPRIAVFSPSKVHATRFATRLTNSGIPAANVSIDDRVEQRRILLEFATGKIKALTAVDVLNEGIDVPDINIIVFLRATHSRRIFIQQLGRGLRISSTKDSVIVLDFVTDIRRIAAVQEIDKESRGKGRTPEPEVVLFPEGVVTFSNDKVQQFVEAWLNDVAGLQDEKDAEKLKFPNLEKFDE